MVQKANAVTVPPPHKALLALVSGSGPQRLTPRVLLHFLFLFVPQLFFIVPLNIFFRYVVFRWRSRTVNLIGRPFYAEPLRKFTANVLSRASVAGGRVIFNRHIAHTQIFKGPWFWGYSDWVTPVKDEGVSGRWIAPPHTRRSDDEVVIFYVHGGGFVLDTGAHAQPFWLKLAKEMNLKRNVQFSIFQLDYELAPEFQYPSQIIETSVAWSWLVNKVGIPIERICISGDSAGGNIVAGFLLNLARPNPLIEIPELHGKLPGRPHHALLISPFVNLCARTQSRDENASFDVIEQGSAWTAALAYIGERTDESHDFVPSWNPIYQFFNPIPPPPHGLGKRTKSYIQQEETSGLALLDSPYVNPSVNEDVEWWNKALPGDGRTMVVWGGAEIFRDEIEDWLEIVEKAGVKPTKVKKPLGVHDWIFYEHFIPGLYKTKSVGPDCELRYGIDQAATFLQDIDIASRKAYWASRSSSSDGVEAPSPDQGLDVGKREPDQPERAEDSMVMVNDPVQGKQKLEDRTKRGSGKGKK